MTKLATNLDSILIIFEKQSLLEKYFQIEKSIIPRKFLILNNVHCVMCKISHH